MAGGVVTVVLEARVECPAGQKHHTGGVSGRKQGAGSSGGGESRLELSGKHRSLYPIHGQNHTIFVGNHRIERS